MPSPRRDEDSVLPESSFTSQSTDSLPRSPYNSVFGLVPSENWYALRLGLCGMWGLEKARRGDGRGEVNGEAFEDLAREKPGGSVPKPGGGCTVRGDCETGVGTRFACQGAGDGRRMMV